MVLEWAGGRWPCGHAIEGGVSWEDTIEGAATITVPLRDPLEAVVGLLMDPSGVAREGITATVDGVRYRVAGWDSDGAGGFVLRMEDEVAARLRAVTDKVSGTRGTYTRAGFVRLLAERLGAPPRPELRAYVPEVLDAQPVAKAR